VVDDETELEEEVVSVLELDPEEMA